MLLVLQFDNSIWSKWLIQHPVITIWMLFRLRYRLFWYQCLSFSVLYFALLGWSIVLLWAQISAWCLDYPIYKTKNSCQSIDADFQDGVMKISCTVLAEKAAIAWYVNYCHEVIQRLPKMQDKKLLRLHWHSYSACGRERATVGFAPKGG